MEKRWEETVKIEGEIRKKESGIDATEVAIAADNGKREKPSNLL
jgi:hypothetical protein